MSVLKVSRSDLSRYRLQGGGPCGEEKIRLDEFCYPTQDSLPISESCIDLLF